jgi:hypothetical protein
MHVILVWLVATSVASAQSTTLVVNDPWVAPGETVRVTVTTVPHAVFAIISSPSGAGGSFAGTALEVGADYVLVASGIADATGRATISYAPPFNAAQPARIYLQAGSVSGSSISLSNGVVLRNLAAQSRITSPSSVPYIEDSGSPPRRIGVAAWHGTWFSWYALLEQDGRFFRVLINESGPMNYGAPTPLELTSPTVWFEDSTCSSRPLVFGGDEWGGDASVIGTTLYIPVVDPLPGPVMLKSQRAHDATCHAVFVPPTEMHLAVTMPFPVFTPPLKLIVPNR